MAAREDLWRTRTSKREKVKEMYPYIIQYTQQSGVPAGNEFARITFVRMEDRIAVPGIYMCDAFLERKKVGFSRTHGTFWSNEVTEGYPSKVKLSRNKERKPPRLYSRKGDATQKACVSTHSYSFLQWRNTPVRKYWLSEILVYFQEKLTFLVERGSTLWFLPKLAILRFFPIY